MSQQGSPNPTGPANLTTSGTYTFNPVATQIIKDALVNLTVINEDEAPTAGQYSSGLQKLNSIVKALEATGIHVWTEEEGILFNQKGQYRYLLGPNSPDHYTDAYSYVVGVLGLSAPAGSMSVQIVLPPTPTSQPFSVIAKGDQFGVVLDSGFVFWTTVSAAPTSNVIPLTAALPSSASAQSFAFDYANPIVRPLKVPSCRRLQYGGLLETPFTPMYSRQEYMDLPNKTNPGTPTAGFYTPKRSVGELYIWPAAFDGNNGTRFTWYRPIQDFNNPDDEMDLPQEWNNALTWQLAAEWGVGQAVPQDTWQRVTMMAAQYRETLLGWDRESEDIQFTMAFDGTDR